MAATATIVIVRPLFLAGAREIPRVVRGIVLRFTSISLCGGALWLSGCAGAGEKSNWSLPFAKTSDQAQAPTPAERIEELRSLAKQAAEMPAADQQQKSEELVRVLNNEPDLLVRIELLRTLGNFPTLPAGAALYAAMQDSDRDIRMACCEAWGRRGGPDAAKVLGEVIRSEQDSDVRLAALRALAQVKDPATVAAIAPALEDPSPAMQWRAVRSLESVTGKSFGDDVNAWRSFVQGGAPREESIAGRIRRFLY